MPALPFRSLLHADSGAEILRLLADAAGTELGADGVAVVEVLATGEAKVVEARHLPEAAASFRADVDVIDAELGERLRATCGGQFAAVHTLPMMSGGDLFGALVLFSSEGAPGLESSGIEPAGQQADARVELPFAMDAERRAQAEMLVDLAAIALGKATQLAELRRVNAELRASRAALKRTEKLRALGEMAAGISHDLNNILNPLSLHLQLLKRILKRGAPGAPEAAQEAIVEMEQVLRRGVETVERLRDFSRRRRSAWRASTSTRWRTRRSSCRARASPRGAPGAPASWKSWAARISSTPGRPSWWWPCST